MIPPLLTALIIKLRRLILSQVPAEVLSITSLIIILCSGILFHNSSNASLFFVFSPAVNFLLKLLVFIWWQRFLASGFMTLFIVPTWSTILPLAEVKRSPFDSSRVGGRIVFITGGTHGGIGFAAAEALLMMGYSVIVSSRGMSMSQTAMLRKLRAAANIAEDQVYFPSMSRHSNVNMLTTHRLVAVDLDLDSEDSIRACVQKVSDLLLPHRLKLHCLVNNAGAAAQPPSQSTLLKMNIDVERDLAASSPNRSLVSCSLGGLEKNIGSNFAGPLLLTDLLISRGLLFSSSASLSQGASCSADRVVHVSSIGHQFTTTFFGSSNRKFFVEEVLGQCWATFDKKEQKTMLQDEDEHANEEDARRQLLATRSRSPATMSSSSDSSNSTKCGIVRARSSISVFGRTISLVTSSSSVKPSGPVQDARPQLFYCDSKLCNALTASAMSKERVRVTTYDSNKNDDDEADRGAHFQHHYSVSPGIAMTAFFRFTMLSKISPFLQKCVHAIASIVAKFPQEGAASTLHCVTNDNDDDESDLRNGEYYSDAVHAVGRLVVNSKVVYQDVELALDVVNWGRKVMKTNVASDSGSV